MENIKDTISSETIKKILGNASMGRKFYNNLTGDELPSNLKANKIWEKIVGCWNYNKALKIVRDLFKESEKYKNGKSSEQALDILLEEWENKEFGSVEWPFAQAPNSFDNFVQRVNNKNIGRDEKDKRVIDASVRYRRIKEINTTRHDFIETLIFEKNKNIMPTLVHSKGMDFFIDGVQFDQKISKSPTKEFVRDFNCSENIQEACEENPAEVAKYLYTYQNEIRFDYKPRLYVVYLEENIEAKKIKEIVDRTNLEIPLDISFSYEFKNAGIKTFKTKCFIILLGENI